MALRTVLYNDIDKQLYYKVGTQLFPVPINTIYTGDGTIQNGNRVVNLGGNQLALNGVPEYADNASALAGGLHGWDLYFTYDGDDRILKLVSEVT